jgi:predicted tellurium resistance membrane protein TerC
MDFLGFPVDRAFLEGAQAFFTVVMIDLVLAGDNAVVIGLAAAGLPEKQRGKAILIGVIAATVLRILFALVATQLLLIVGLLFAGGVLLLWVCWKMWRELRQPQNTDEEAITGKDLDGDGKIAGRPIRSKTLSVAGAAHEHPWIMVFGLALSVLLMGIAATFIAKLLHKHRWIAYIGLAIILYVSLHMMWDGSRDVCLRGLPFDWYATPDACSWIGAHPDSQPAIPVPAH